MVSSTTGTVSDYLKSLPAEHRRALSALRRLIRQRLPRGYEEGMEYGMISYFVPLTRYPETYNGKPLTAVSLAAQRNHLALHLMTIYGDAEAQRRLAEAFDAARKRLSMGKACIRFQSLEDLALDAIGGLLAEASVETFIARYEAGRASGRELRRPAKQTQRASLGGRRAAPPSPRRLASRGKKAGKARPL